jgi:hypothetical protein
MKRLLTIVFMAFLLASTPLQADAAPELSLGSAEVLPGQTASLNLKLAGGTEKYAGVNVTIQLPENISINVVSKGALLNSGFTSDYSTDGNKLRIIAYSSSTTISGTGTLFSLSLKADEDASEGEQDISFITTSSELLNPNALSNSDGSKSISPTLKDGKITILKEEEPEEPDELPDDWEMKYFGNLDQGPDDDPDRDGYTNLQEYQSGTHPNDPNDIDNDWLPDDWEQQIIDADPNDAITTIEDVKPGDDFDGDGDTNLEEYQKGTPPTSAPNDVDKDGLPDDWEIKYFRNLNEKADGNTDGDGCNNLEEYQYDTDPTRADCPPSDVNGDKTLNLRDAIIALKVSCGMNLSSLNMAGDVNGDEQIGIHEAIFVLDQLSRITD